MCKEVSLSREEIERFEPNCYSYATLHNDMVCLFVIPCFMNQMKKFMNPLSFVSVLLGPWRMEICGKAVGKQKCDAKAHVSR